jgi:TRAP-type C4-dicarboxylate transport system substrate-binding protein
MNKIFKAVATAAALGIVSTSAGLAEDWDMPTPYPDKTFHTVNIQQFADEVREATNGELNIKLHSAGSLIKHGEIKNSVRNQIVPTGEFFLSLLANEDPAFGIDSLPLVAVSYQDAAKLWEAQEPVVTELLAKQRLKPLFSVPWPPQGLYTKKEIKTVDDLSGLKFRSYNANLEKFATLVGAAPTQVEAPDIPQAFATGQVEAMITSPSTGANSKAWDFLSHYTPINAWVPKNIVVVNIAAFNALDEETQAAVLEAAERAEERGWNMSRREAEEKTQELAENGITIVEPSQELKDGLAKVGVELLDDWRANSTPAADKIIDAYYN